MLFVIHAAVLAPERVERCDWRHKGPVTGRTKRLLVDFGRCRTPQKESPAEAGLETNGSFE
jgi:hypothetical protein